MTQPSVVLTTPSDAAAVPPLADTILDSGGFLSPAYWVNWAITQMCGYDPVAEVIKNFSGDWNAVMRSSRALEHLGEYYTELAAEVRVANSTAQADWDGNAAKAAETYFVELATALEEQSQALSGIAGQYQAVSVGMSQTADLVQAAMHHLMDLAIIAAASAAAAAASSWTIVGGIAGGAGTAIAIAKGVKVAADILRYHNYAIQLCNGIVGATAGYLGAIHGFENVALPSAYDHQGH